MTSIPAPGHTPALVAVLTVLCLPLTAAAQSDAYASFEDGNRLFRENLYWAALLRYRQAGEQGMDTPLLHYNTGIAHYRAGQHVRARESLLRALADPALLNAARYNLGLNAWALGDSEEALRWFRAVRDQQANEKLRQFAVVAISRIRAAQQTPSEYAVPPASGRS